MKSILHLLTISLLHSLLCGIAFGDSVINVDFMSFADSTAHSGANGVLSSTGTYWNAFYPYSSYRALLDENGISSPIGIGRNSVNNSFTSALPNTLQDSGYTGYFQCWFAPLADNATYDLVIYVAALNTLVMVEWGNNITNIVSSSADGPTGVLPGTKGRDYLILTNLTELVGYNGIYITVAYSASEPCLVAGLQLREHLPLNQTPTNILLSSTNVAENMPGGTTVGSFSTQDPDIGNTFTYTLVAGTGSGDNGSFNISGSNLLTAAVFNYEVKSNYSIRMQSADQGGLSTQKVFSINVTNVNETPTNILLSSTNVAENLPVTTKVGSFSTQDPDFNNTFTYTLVAGTGSGDNGSFATSTSNLLTSAAFNYEVKSNYSIRVQSIDQGGLSTQKVFAIGISDIDEKPAFGEIDTSAGSNCVIRWSSVTNHLYNIHYSTSLLAGFTILQSNIPATPSMNSYTDAVLSISNKFWKVTTVP